MTRRPSPVASGASTRGRRSLVTATLLSALLATLVLGGCSSGAVSQTDTTVSTVTGAMGQTGEMLVRDLSLDPGPAEVVPAGSPVTLRGTLVNEAPGEDQLVSVSTPYATAVVAQGVTTVPGDNATMLVGSSPVPVGPPAPDTRVTGTARITLNGVTQVLHSGPTYPVTLTFAHAGTITVPTPVISTGAVPVS